MKKSENFNESMSPLRNEAQTFFCCQSQHQPNSLYLSVRACRWVCLSGQRPNSQNSWPALTCGFWTAASPPSPSQWEMPLMCYWILGAEENEENYYFSDSSHWTEPLEDRILARSKTSLKGCQRHRARNKSKTWLSDVNLEGSLRKVILHFYSLLVRPTWRTTFSSEAPSLRHEPVRAGPEEAYNGDREGTSPMKTGWELGLFSSPFPCIFTMLLQPVLPILEAFPYRHL